MNFRELHDLHDVIMVQLRQQPGLITLACDQIRVILQICAE